VIDGEHVTLSDGTPVVVRMLRPEDKELLREGFNRLSPESRYARFLVPKAALTDAELRYLTEIDQVDHVAIGAADMNGVGVGIARFVRLADPPTTAEAAITVADEYQRKGLGTLLLSRLCDAARQRGIERFRCEVLGSNTSMRALIDHLAPERTIEVGGGVMTIEMALPTGPAPESGLYRLLRSVAKGTIELTDSVRRLWRR